MTIDALSDAFASRFNDQAIAKLPLASRKKAQQIRDAFDDLESDDVLKSAVDEWMAGDQSEPLTGIAANYPEGRSVSRIKSGRVGAQAIDPAMVLALIQLAMKLIDFLSRPRTVSGSAAMTDETAVLEAALQEAEASEASEAESESQPKGRGKKRGH